jgi:glucose-6-phosphate-specific signal transduction histidine kinase
MELMVQAVWAFMVIACAWFCFEGSRFDRTPMRFLAFLAVGIGILHGANELHRLAEVLQGYPITRDTGWEILLPFVLVFVKYFHVVRVNLHG